MSRSTLWLRALALTAVVAGAAVTLPGGASASQEPTGWWTTDGATWTQAFITEPDGTKLHADVLRPTDLPLTAKTPVILSIGPYYGHAGELGPDGVEDDPIDWYPLGADGDGDPSPDNRFRDFIEGTHLFQNGYTWVQVDLRGFGGSTGCTDFGGEGEQADVYNAVKWAASQPWSNGRVGMYGKSYDAFTGIMGEAMAPPGLDAIVAQEPVYDGYWNDYAYGVTAFGPETQAEDYNYSYTPNFTPGDSPQYIVDSEDKNPSCAKNFTGQHNSNRFSPWWQQHDLIAEAEGHKVPIFMTQGFLENNTKPLGAWDFFDELKAPKHAWFDMTDHIRGNDVAEGDDAAPQPWFDEVMRFYNHYLKQIPFSNPAGATNKDPAIAVETSDGTWRAEQQWPPLDSKAYTVTLEPGTYTDAANTADDEDQAGATGDTEGVGDWTISPPLPYAAHFSGVPEAALDVTAELPASNLSVDVYDIHPNDTSFLVSRTAYQLKQGEQQVYAEMYGDDWEFAAGDRVGILVTSANDDWWDTEYNEGTVTVNPGSLVTLPWLAYERNPADDLTGYKYPARLKTWLGGAGNLTIPAATITSGLDPKFTLPPAQTAPPAGFNKGAIGLSTTFHSDGENASPGSIN